MDPGQTTSPLLMWTQHPPPTARHSQQITCVSMHADIPHAGPCMYNARRPPPSLIRRHAKGVAGRRSSTGCRCPTRGMSCTIRAGTHAAAVTATPASHAACSCCLPWAADGSMVRTFPVPRTIPSSLLCNIPACQEQSAVVSYFQPDSQR